MKVLFLALVTLLVTTSVSQAQHRGHYGPRPVFVQPIVRPVYTPPIVRPVYTPPIVRPVYTPPVYVPIYTTPVYPVYPYYWNYFWWNYRY